MDIFWAIAVVLFLAWCIVTDIIYIVIRLTKLYICRNIADCKNRKCLVNETCKKYSESLTQEEYDYLTKLIEESFTEESILKMRVYRDVHTVVELTEEQHERLKSLVKQAQVKDATWTEKKALEFLSMIRCPDFWDIQLNFFEKTIVKD